MPQAQCAIKVPNTMRDAQLGVLFHPPSDRNVPALFTMCGNVEFV